MSALFVLLQIYTICWLCTQNAFGCKFVLAYCPFAVAAFLLVALAYTGRTFNLWLTSRNLSELEGVCEILLYAWLQAVAECRDQCI